MSDPNGAAKRFFGVSAWNVSDPGLEQSGVLPPPL